ncbi:hypothetical protein F383_22827 [Gossypium arboreum]|uniref:Uncharacterized protein n=1 Tax=Gossypium arboreum TaxID=29729 RepID=A0A0B0MNX7_GOSAR|nr:hypothetical protein F383_22827 [Gossypium arboreum]
MCKSIERLICRLSSLVRKMLCLGHWSGRLPKDRYIDVIDWIDTLIHL